MTDLTDSVLVALENSVLTLTRNGPKYRIAMSREMTPMLTRLMREAQAHSSVRFFPKNGSVGRLPTVTECRDVAYLSSL